jgi:hypothetical protein
MNAKRVITIMALSALTSAAYVDTMFAKKHATDNAEKECLDKAKKCCKRLPQPPVNDVLSLEGENCSCCFESCDLQSGSRNLNANKVCQSYEELCAALCLPVNFPPFVNPAELTYQTNPAMSTVNPPHNVPPCQKLINPPCVPKKDRICLKGKNVLVIGASKNIGKAIAELFAHKGANVVATSRHPECYEKPKGYKLKKLDVRFEEEVKRFVEKQAKKFHGKIDILVNLPAVAWHGVLADATGTDLLNALDNNLVGYQRVTHYALPFMRHSNETRVISFASFASEFLVPFWGGYVISKVGMQAWNDMMQLEELFRKAQGVVPFGPTFSLMEPFFVHSTIDLYENYQPSTVGSDDPYVLGARLSAIVPQCIQGDPTSLAARAVYNVAGAKRPGVRYAVTSPEDVVTLPDGTIVPVLEVVQQSHTISPDDNVNLQSSFFAAGFYSQAFLEQSREAALAAFCAGQCNGNGGKEK